MKLRTNKRRRLLSETLETRHLLAGPYAPAADQIGSDAIGHDDVAIVAWASRVAEYSVGSNVDIAFQTAGNSLGPAESGLPATVSLGRGGSLTLAFDAPIRDGLGADFAVFENSVSDTFLELGYVEVSSDGVNFFRFQSDSLTPSAVDAFGNVDPTDINNLAGKYRAGFGTPFDLEELAGVSVQLDTTAITHVRLVDVVGDGSNLDASGDAIYDPYATVGSAGLDVDAVGVIHQVESAFDVAGFEDVGAGLATASSFSGPDPNGTSMPGPFNNTITTGSFTSETMAFNNANESSFGAWTGWAYSNVTDNTAAGFTNQFGSFAGGGASDSATFGVGFADGSGVSALPTITRDDNDLRKLNSLKITNTTYAALSMTNGDSFAKKFGGDTGDDADLFLLTINGKDAVGASIGIVEFYLADFRFSDNAMDYIVSDWTEVDVSSIADARTIEFSVNSSDVGSFGVNTPAYFAVDDIQFAKPVLPIDIADRRVVESDGNLATTVRVSRADSDTTQPMTVFLTSVDASVATVPTMVTIDAGQRYAEFPVGVVDDELASGTKNISIVASADGLVSGSVSLAIADDDARALAVSLAGGSVGEGDTIELTVRRNDADLSSSLTVRLDTVTPGLDVPQTVVIESGAATQTVSIAAVDDDIDGPDQTVTITASATGYTDAQASLDVIDNDQATVQIQYTGDPLNESMAPTTVGLEDVGATLPAGSFYNGNDSAGEFTSTGVQFNNSYNSTFGSWSGWAYSNATDTTTPGFTNQYSAITGMGAGTEAGGSETYAVASAFIVPRVVRDEGSGEFGSIEITNTTYAALSVQQGDSFAKKFGGETGDDEDFFLLTIEGIDGAGDSVGTIDFYLADYRFANNDMDYIVDQWTTVDLSSLSQALSLEFSLSSSDVGQYGMNTPAYFAADNLMLAAATTPTAVVSRNTQDVSAALDVMLSSDDESELVVPAIVTIPAGESTVEVPLGVQDDLIADGPQNVTLSAQATGLIGSAVTLTVGDDDSAALVLTALDKSVEEGQTGRLLIHRNSDDLDLDLEVSLNSSIEITIDASATIPAGSRTVEVVFSVVDNDEIDSDRDATIEASASDLATSQVTVRITNDDFPPAELMLELDALTLSESDARATVSFEDIGATVADESFDNGAGGAGGFVSADVTLNNSFNPDFGSWGGWSLSNKTDLTTAGFTNQYSVITGGGAHGSATYAVASAFSGGTAPALTLGGDDTSRSFDSLMITNTTYAALSMRDGDLFAKQFGGETGDDPDFFLLQIDGFSAAGESVGMIDFYLADFRFDDNNQDYIVDAWTSVDVSSLTDATELRFSLSSSDVGDFGMNTPAYFAIDQVVVSDSPSKVITATVSRNDQGQSSPLVVSLSSDDMSEATLPSTVVIPAGSASTTFSIEAVDDSIFDGLRHVTINASAQMHRSVQQQISITDDDQPTLTMSAASNDVFESSTSGTSILVHRNTANLTVPLTVGLSLTDDSTSNALQFPSGVTIPAGARTVVLTVSAIDNSIVQGDQTARLAASAIGFSSAPLMLTVVDDEFIGLIVQQPDGETVVGQPQQADDLTVRLAAQPDSDVVIEVITASPKILLSQTQLTFTSDQWNVPQTLQLTSRFDFEVEQDYSADVTFRVVQAASDVGFAGLADVNIPVRVDDYQPSRVRLYESGSELHLTDDDMQVDLVSVDGLDGYVLVANDASQTIVVDPLTRTRGLIQIDAAGGDDTVVVRGLRFSSLDGGDGYDRLVVDMGLQSVDFVGLFANRTTRFEEYVVAGDTPAELLLDAATISSLANDNGRVIVQLSATQRLSLTGEVTEMSPVMVLGRFAQVVQMGDAELIMISQTPYRNTLNRFDVDHSGGVTPADIVAVINRIAEGPADLSGLNSIADFDGRYVDVTGDGLLTPNDIKAVIEYLAESAAGARDDAAGPQREWLSVDAIVRAEFEMPSREERDVPQAVEQPSRPGSVALIDQAVAALFSESTETAPTDLRASDSVEPASDGLASELESLDD